MNWRFFSVVLLFVLALVADLRLVASEEIVEVEARKADTRRADPLFSMRFTADQREKNMRDMGFDAAQVATILTRIEGFAVTWHTGDPDRNVLLARIRDTPDLDALVAALCGVGASGMAGSPLPVRYHAMKFLVEEREGARVAIDPSAVSAFEYQEEWVTRSRMDSVYEGAELSENRRADATRMAMAALLAGKDGEAEFLRGDSGWGNGLFGVGGWSWDRVVRDHPGVEARVLAYAAFMHLVAEQAHSEEGICGSEDTPEPAPNPAGGL